MAMYDDLNRTYAKSVIGKIHQPRAAFGAIGDCDDARAVPALPKPVEVTRDTLGAAVILAQRIESLVDDIAGPKRTADGNKGEGGIRGEPMGVLPELADQARQVDAVIRSAHAALDRLREVI